MGILKDLFFGNSDKNEERKEKAERISVRGTDERREIYDKDGHWQEEHRWNPETDEWDKLDFHGNVIGHIRRDMHGDMVHTDYFNRITGVDKREDSRTVAHYDSKGNKTGYTTKDLSNNLTKHTYIEEKDIWGRKKSEKEDSPGFLQSLLSASEEYNRKLEEIRGEEESLYADDEDEDDSDDRYSYDSDYDYDEDDDDYGDDYDDEYDDEYDDADDEYDDDDDEDYY